MSFAASWMDLKIVILGEVSQTEKEKYPMILLICGILKKGIQMNLFTKQKESYRCRKQTMVTKGGKWGEVRDKLGDWN